MPRRNNLWLFGARGGFSFSDNSKYLFLYIQKECKGIDAIWITKNRKIIHNLKEQHIPVYYAYRTPLNSFDNTKARIWYKILKQSFKI